MLYSSTGVLYQETYPALLRPWYKHFLKLWCLCPASPSLFFEAFSLPDSPFLHFQQVSWSLDLSESRMVQTLRSRCEETLSGLLEERVLFTGFGMCRHEDWSCLRHPAAMRLMNLSRKQMWRLERNGPQGHLPAELDLKSGHAWTSSSASISSLLITASLSWIFCFEDSEWPHLQHFEIFETAEELCSVRGRIQSPGSSSSDWPQDLGGWARRVRDVLLQE